MKILNNIKYLLLFAVVATSCSDYLDEENKSNIVADEYFTTEAGFESLINSNYASLRDIYGDEAYIFTMGTDLYTSGRGTPPALGLLNYQDLTPAEGNGGEYVLNFYRDLYEAIQLANNAMYFWVMIFSRF